VNQAGPKADPADSPAALPIAAVQGGPSGDRSEASVAPLAVAESQGSSPVDVAQSNDLVALARQDGSGDGGGVSQVQVSAAIPPSGSRQSEDQTGAAVGVGQDNVAPGSPRDSSSASTIVQVDSSNASTMVQVPIAGPVPLGPYSPLSVSSSSTLAATATSSNALTGSIFGPEVGNVAPGPGGGDSSGSSIPTLTEATNSARKAAEIASVQADASGSRPTSGTVLPLAPSLDDANDQVRELFQVDRSRKVRTDSLASALAEAYRGNPPSTAPPPPPGDYSVSLDPGPIPRGDGEHEDIGLGPWAGAGALTIAQMLEQLEDSPQEVDLLAETLPFDPAKWEQAIEQYLDRIDGLGGILTDLMTSPRLQPWLHGAALAAVGSVLAHRLRRKAKSAVRGGTGGIEPEGPWLLDLHPEET
jgi:hypothetical protein